MAGFSDPSVYQMVDQLKIYLSLSLLWFLLAGLSMESPNDREQLNLRSWDQSYGIQALK